MTVPPEPPVPLWRRHAESLARGRPALEHLLRAADRYTQSNMNLLAGGVTYYGFLAAFPLTVLAFVLVAVVQRLVPQLESDLQMGLEALLTALVGDAEAGPAVLTTGGLVAAGVAVAVSLYAGLRWLVFWRRSFQLVAGGDPHELPSGRLWLGAVLGLAVVGAWFIGSVVLTAFATRATQLLQEALSLEGPARTVLVRGGTFAAVLIVDTLAFVTGFVVAGRDLMPRRQLVVGGVVAAVGFEVLKTPAVFLALSSSNEIYGALAATAGLLIWIAWVSRWVLFVVGWSATALGEVPAPTPGRAAPDGDAAA